MKHKIKVLFLGNHNVGIKALEAILVYADLVGVVAHPLDAEEGVVYDSVFDFVDKLGIDTIRGKGKDENIYQFIKERKPDLIWITDYKYIIPKKIIDIAKLGAINLHPSLLPKYKGRAPINWAIIAGEASTGLTAHYIDEGVDTGDIIEQVTIEINSNDYIADILDKLYPIYFNITKKVISDLAKNKVKRFSQTGSDTKIYPRRTKKDGLINWELSANLIYNLIRAVSKPYPGAFSFIDNQQIVIWKAFLKPLTQKHKNLKNGFVIIQNEAVFVKCSDAILVITDWETETKQIKTGNMLSNYQSDNNQNNIDFYSKLVNKHGLDVKSLNWGSQQSQELRFKVLSEIGNLEGKSILDVGCGLGDFYNWLKKNNIDVDYTGVDITPNMIKMAKERFINTNFKLKDILKAKPEQEKYDFVFASGIFYLLQNSPFEVMQKTIQRMFDLSKKGLAFNSLSDWADEKSGNEFFASPIKTFEFCSSITNKITIRHEYHPADFTIYLYKK